MHTTFIRKNRSLFFSTLLLVSLSLFVSTNRAKAYIMYSSSPVKITWSSQNVVPGSCTKSENYTSSIWTGGVTENGSQVFPGNTIAPASPATYTFTFRCTSLVDGSTLTSSDTLNVTPAKVKLAITKPGDANPFPIPPLTFTLSATRYYVPKGKNTVVTWNYSDLGGTCTGGNNWSGTRPLSGSITYYPTSYERTLTLSLTCSSPNYPVPATRSISIDFDCNTTGCSTR